MFFAQIYILLIYSYLKILKVIKKVNTHRGYEVTSSESGFLPKT